MTKQTIGSKKILVDIAIPPHNDAHVVAVIYSMNFKAEE
jgi:hypothetical protein